MKKKGFTLIEVLAVITILGLLITMITPKVMSNIKNKRNTLYENTVKEIEKVSSMYLTNNPDLYGKISNDGFTNISINSLCIDNLINCPVVDPRDGSEINGYVKVSYIDNKYEYEFINEEYINENILLDIVLNGGSISSNPTGTYKEGDLVEIGIPTKEGNDFVNWEVVKGNSKLSGNKLTIGSTDTILYAVWESYSNLVIDLDGGTSSNNQSGSYKSGTNIKLVEPTKENYKFVGWEVIEGNGVLSGNTFTMGTGNVLIKAIWELNVFSLEVNLDGGSTTQEFKSEYAVGETITLETPIKTGYTFTGWSVSGTGATLSGTNLKVGTSDIILTAIWEEYSTIAVPTQSGTLTYSGIAQSPAWNNYDTSKMTIDGTTSGTNVGTYSVTFIPKEGYMWEDKTTTAKTVNWSIEKATSLLSLSASSGTIEGKKGATKAFTVNYNGDATISVKSSNTGVATASISGKTVTVTSVATGSATITVSVGTSSNYTTPTSVTYSVDTIVRLWIIGNGVDAKTVTGGFPVDWHTDWQVFNSDGSVTLKHSYGDATFRHDYWTYNTFDVTNYKKLVVRATAWDTNQAFNVGVNTVANRGSDCIKKVSIGGVPTTVTLDISDITGSVCFQVDMPYYGYSITISEVYFE